MKRILVCAMMLMAGAAGAAWEGLTEENYACGPKLSATQLSGRVVLVDMWATWCGPCRMVMPHTVELAKKYKSKGLIVIGSHVERGFSKDQVANVVASEKWDGISYYKEAKWTGGSIGFDGGIPFLYVINKKGKVVAHGRNFGAIENAIADALSQAGGASFIEQEELVEYKHLAKKLAPGKPVEGIMKTLKADIATANKNPSSETYAKRKTEAVKIAKAVKAYKADLISTIEAEIEAGEKEEAVKHIDLLIATWPSAKGEWAAKKKGLVK